MIYDPALLEVRFVRRYQRFFAECVTIDGQQRIAHCANTGRMTGLLEVGARAWIRVQPPGRKLGYAWELVETTTGMACVNTARANGLVADAEPLSWWGPVTAVRREPRVGAHRFDLAYRTGSGRDALIEVKTVTWAVDGIGYFPDAPSARATAHIRLLTELASHGQPVGVLFVAMHTGISEIRPAAMIDPAFTDALRQAAAVGVQIGARRVAVTPSALTLDAALPVELTAPA
jgi:sugar fermentation stimulation protein A